jgi:S1-C subfamily serine protease
VPPTLTARSSSPRTIFSSIGSPAARAGIREGDLLIEAAGRPLTDSDALATILAETGMPIELKIVRGDEERAVSVGGTTDASGEA